jgi:hypothetical protein
MTGRSKVLLRRIFPLLTIAALSIFGGAVSVSAQSSRLTGKPLAKAVTGMEFGDGVHWSERYAADGALNIVSMGRRIGGRWFLRGDKLCKETPRDGLCCHEVWRVGDRIEHRPDCGLPVMEGSFSRPE